MFHFNCLFHLEVSVSFKITREFSLYSCGHATLPFVSSRYLFLDMVIIVLMYLRLIVKVKEEHSYPCMLLLIILGVKVVLKSWLIYADCSFSLTILLYVDGRLLSRARAIYHSCHFTFMHAP